MLLIYFHSASSLFILSAGGGLSVNYTSDDVTPTLLDYADALRAACPEVFCIPSSSTGTMKASGSNPRLTIITGTFISTSQQKDIAFLFGSYFVFKYELLIF